MRKSLKTECKQLSVALVSRIRLSNCFSISCVFDSILWEKSWRNRKSYGERGVAALLSLNQSRTYTHTVQISAAFLQHFSDSLRKIWGSVTFLNYPRVSCQGPAGTVLTHLFKCPRSLPNRSSFLWLFTPTESICHSLRHCTHLQLDHQIMNNSEELLNICH